MPCGKIPYKLDVARLQIFVAEHHIVPQGQITKIDYRRINGDTDPTAVSCDVTERAPFCSLTVTGLGVSTDNGRDSRSWICRYLWKISEVCSMAPLLDVTCEQIPY